MCRTQALKIIRDILFEIKTVFIYKIQRAASIAGSRSGSIIGPGLVNTSTGPYNSSMSSQPPLPPPPSSTLEAERMRWSASQGARGPGFSDNMMKQNVYAVSGSNYAHFLITFILSALYIIFNTSSLCYSSILKNNQ